MASVRVQWNPSALGRFIGNCAEGRRAGEEALERICDSANLMAESPTGGRYSGYPDGGILTHPEEPEYSTQMVEGRSGYSWVGFVHASNGAAYADAAKNNTLLKALGG